MVHFFTVKLGRTEIFYRLYILMAEVWKFCDIDFETLKFPARIEVLMMFGIFIQRPV